MAVGPGPILMSHDALTVNIFTECLVNIFALRQSFCLLLSATSCVWYENVNDLYGNILSLIHVKMHQNKPFIAETYNTK